MLGPNQLTIAAIKWIGPRDALEDTIAAQMIACHDAAMLGLPNLTEPSRAFPASCLKLADGLE
jgi:hypothetical protein